MNTAQDIAIAARKLIETGWTQDVTARDANGNPCEYRDEQACSFCVLGAVYRAWRNLTPNPADISREDVCKIFNLMQSLTGGTATWNDLPKRKHAEVLALFDKAIDVLKLEAA